MPSQRGPHGERPRAHRSNGMRRRRPRRAWAESGVLRPDRHRLVTPEDPGRVLPRRRLAHLRPPDPVGGGRDDLRRTALRHRHHRRARSGRSRRHERGARPGRDAVDRAATGHPAAVPRRLVSLRGDQARPVAGGPAAVAAAGSRRARAQLLGLGHRDDLHSGRGCLPRGAGARSSRNGRDAGPARRRRARRRGRGPVHATVLRSRHRRTVPAGAASRSDAGGRARHALPPRPALPR